VFWLEIKPQRQLCNAVTAGVSVGRQRLSKVGVAEIVRTVRTGPRICEVGMVEDVEEVGIKSQLGAFRDAEALADSEVKIYKLGSRNRTAPKI